MMTIAMMMTLITFSWQKGYKMQENPHFLFRGSPSLRLRISQAISWGIADRHSLLQRTGVAAAPGASSNAQWSVWSGRGSGGRGRWGVSESWYNLISCFSSPAPSPSPPFPSPFSSPNNYLWGTGAVTAADQLSFCVLCVRACECARIPASDVRPLDACGESLLVWGLEHVCFYSWMYALSMRGW